MKMGVLGEKLPHTLSPAIHQKILKKIGKEGAYGVYEKTADELDAFFKEVRAGGYLGLNVTIPHKINVMAYLDELSGEAKNIGAVNTVHVRDGRLTGHNTDYFGFGYMLKKAGIDPRGKKACILGAGGAAKAVAVYLRDAGAAVKVISRSCLAVKPGFEGFELAGYDQIAGDILVNTTPIGMSPDAESSPLLKEELAGFEAVADIIYNPRQTKLLRFAQELGIHHAGRLSMLVAQAVKSQEIWQQMKIPEGLIDAIAEEF